MALLRYPGGKKKLSDQIISKLADIHKGDLQYREPFFGGGGIGMKYIDNTKRIWINDKDIGIACLWTAVIRYPNDLKKLISKFKPSVKTFYEFKKELTDSPVATQRNEIIEIGLKKIAVHQMSYSGLGLKAGPLGGVDQQSKYKINCRWSPNKIRKNIDILNSKLREKDIYGDGCTNFDFMQLIEDVSCDSLLYLDPPYYEEGNNLYHFGFSAEDHKRLAKTLKTTDHLWLLSYDDCKEIRSLYDWANIELINVKYSVTSHRSAQELLISKT